jgi:hypothetical protein
MLKLVPCLTLVAAISSQLASISIAQDSEAESPVVRTFPTEPAVLTNGQAVQADEPPESLPTTPTVVPAAPTADVRPESRSSAAGDDLWKILLTAFLSFVVFVLGQIFQKAFVEPVMELRKVLGEAQTAFTYYANVYTNPIRWNLDKEAMSDREKESRDRASDALRDIAARLKGQANSIVWYSFGTKLRLLPPIDLVEELSKCFIGLSNSVWSKDSLMQMKHQESTENVLGRIASVNKSNRRTRPPSGQTGRLPP